MDLEQFTLAQLRELAKTKGIKGITKYKKDELIILLNDGLLKVVPLIPSSIYSSIIGKFFFSQKRFSIERWLEILSDSPRF